MTKNLKTMRQNAVRTITCEGGYSTYRVYVDGSLRGTLSASQMAGSCGVYTINGISTLNAITGPARANWKAVRKEATIKLLDYIKRAKNATFLVLSNNERTTLINNTMNEIANKTSDVRRSRSTGSQIRVWIY